MRLSLSPFYIAHQDFPGCTFCAVCWLWRRPFFLHLSSICCFNLGYWFLLQIEEQSYQIDGGDRRDDTQGDDQSRRLTTVLFDDGIIFRLAKSQFTQHQTDALPLLRQILMLGQSESQSLLFRWRSLACEILVNQFFISLFVIVSSSLLVP